MSSLAGHDELGHTAHWLCMLRGMTATQPCQLPREQQVRLKTRKIRSGRLPEFSYGTVYVQLEDGSHCARANISCIRVSLCPFRAIKNPKENAFLALKTRKIFWPAGAQLSVLRRQKQGFLPVAVHKIASLYCERPLPFTIVFLSRPRAPKRCAGARHSRQRQECTSGRECAPQVAVVHIVV